MIRFDDIRTRLAGHRFRTLDDASAHRSAVALIMREGAGAPELLYILRARRDGDPWSGHIAFPGGRVSPCDTDIRTTAERETREELGVDLARSEYLGRLDDISATTRSMRVAGFVYRLESRTTFTANHEVHRVFWTPLTKLADPVRQVRTTVQDARGSREVPAIDVLGSGYPTLWGLTYRFTAQLLRFSGVELPE